MERNTTVRGKKNRKKNSTNRDVVKQVVELYGQKAQLLGQTPKA